jgi:hypothetical protein
MLLMVPTQEKQIFPLNPHLTELFFYFWYDNGGPYGKDVHVN